MKETIIKTVKIGPYPKDITNRKIKEVRVTYKDGTEEVLFEFYPDEIDFKEEEFVGLTNDEAKRMKFEKDREWLRG